MTTFKKGDRVRIKTIPLLENSGRVLPDAGKTGVISSKYGGGYDAWHVTFDGDDFESGRYTWAIELDEIPYDPNGEGETENDI